MFTPNDYMKIKQYRKNIVCTEEEKAIVCNIKKNTEIANVDNISRTQSYQEFYIRNSEIRWSFLASMVSRNAGWNMTDLEGRYYATVLPQSVKKHFFLMYEQANWIIFLDAFPQLLLYEESKRRRIPLFHLLQFFNVSIFMEKEWTFFWERRDINRLMTALIINEQNKIQKPVIENTYFKKHVFHTALFKVQEMFHISAVIFPTIEGRLYGFSVYQFETLQKRIELGKKLAWLLFHEKYKNLFYTFALETTHTGSREDYEYYLRETRRSYTPVLRDVCSVVAHEEISMKDWFYEDVEMNVLFLFEEPKGEVHITEWYRRKRENIHAVSIVNRFVKRIDEFMI
ncbi:hypothetical protein CN491_07040 [Bacillus cereus]|uniref:DUF2515 domain-containing protein n=1 Tax=Bacillus cereus TaxID=1396 RepID=A0A2A8LTT2_BACCE|nr:MULTISPECIES: DUF2515 domain-containing protein [Bacillus cereus group]MDR4985385.1 DUF2515 domain-containing protein [Bacillus cereus]MEA1009519.1 DUF2515 domain-containing protein [Bacillus cereus]PES97051.1 hypothetical protein CN491_07040 [Bacillus cereus]PFP80815.1 hypothetical protein COJ95_07600 [Bacillus cereus]PGT18706.1 hypothetical protein COC96_08330 [Bacillus cereus]